MCCSTPAPSEALVTSTYETALSLVRQIDHIPAKPKQKQKSPEQLRIIEKLTKEAQKCLLQTGTKQGGPTKHKIANLSEKTVIGLQQKMKQIQDGLSKQGCNTVAPKLVTDSLLREMNVVRGDLDSLGETIKQRRIIKFIETHASLEFVMTAIEAEILSPQQAIKASRTQIFNLEEPKVIGLLESVGKLKEKVASLSQDLSKVKSPLPRSRSVLVAGKARRAKPSEDQTRFLRPPGNPADQLHLLVKEARPPAPFKPNVVLQQLPAASSSTISALVLPPTAEQATLRDNGALAPREVVQMTLPNAVPTDAPAVVQQKAPRGPANHISRIRALSVPILTVVNVEILAFQDSFSPCPQALEGYQSFAGPNEPPRMDDFKEPPRRDESKKLEKYESKKKEPSGHHSRQQSHSQAVRGTPRRGTVQVDYSADPSVIKGAIEEDG